jgi:hypothetical protein
MKKYFPLQFHLLYEYDLPKNSFLINNCEYNVETILQIWMKQDEKRELINKKIPQKFIFVKKKEDHDISFRRVGVYAGKIDRDTKEKNSQSHYFIKFLNIQKSIDEIITLLNTIEYTHNNTVGPKSISKQELIHEFNKIL